MRESLLMLKDREFLLEEVSKLPVLPEISSSIIWTRAQSLLIFADRAKYKFVADWIDYRQKIDFGLTPESPIKNFSQPDREAIEVLGNYLYCQLKAIIGAWDSIKRVAKSRKVSLPFKNPREYFVETQREITLKYSEEWFSLELSEGGKKYWSDYFQQLRQFFKKKHKNQKEIEQQFFNLGWGGFWIAAVLTEGLPRRKTTDYYKNCWSPLIEAQTTYERWILANPLSLYRFKDGSIFASPQEGGKALREVVL